MARDKNRSAAAKEETTPPVAAEGQTEPVAETAGATDAPSVVVPEAESPPEATLSVEAEPVVQVSAAAEEKMVTVVPRVTVSSCRIGNDYYSFLKGVAVKVPASVRAHLAEKRVV